VNKPPLFDGLHELVVEVCERNITDPTRWSQTCVGWVMRELTMQAPHTVKAFVAANADRMSTEAIKAAAKNL
jgi:3-methyladenine DNA glycosylase AlkD